MYNLDTSLDRRLGYNALSFREYANKENKIKLLIYANN